MASGGARARSGQAPDPNALRRDRNEGEWLVLPASGRVGRAPAWPLTKQTAREKTLWTRLWKLPQAIQWERAHQELEVGLYVRTLMEAESIGAPAALRTLVRQQAEGLGLSIPGLARNRWRIKHVEPTANEAPADASTSSKRRLKVVRSDGSGG
jgi:hypothetical protein